METLNLKRLANELNLAPSSVSRALRDSHEIGRETKVRVKALAEKWGFQPNPHASSLRQSKSKTIAVIIPEVQNNFFAQVINGIEEVAKAKGYHILIYLTHEDQHRENEILNLLRNGRVDGIMISVSNTTNDFEQLEAYNSSGMPLVFFDRVNDAIKVPRVSSDDEQASYEGTKVLVKSGCKKIALLTLSDNLSICKHRNTGYEKALSKYGLLEYKYAVECGNDNELNRQKIRELFVSDYKPDGIIAAIEQLAINTYEVCKEMHIQISKELKVISFSNLSAAALFSPSLSVIVQPAYEIGKKATDILFKIIEKKPLLADDKKVTLSSSIIERKSTSG